MVWTVRWRGAEGYRRGRLSRYFSRFSFLRAGAFGFILAAPEQNALAGGWLLLRLSARAAVFSLLLRWRRNID